MSIIEKIKEHEKEVLCCKIPEDLDICPICNTSSQAFKRHERRYRIFYIIIECYVQRKDTWLGRWKCSICNKTFTYYPEHCIPYKRYVKENIIEFSSKYLSNDSISYCDVVKCDYSRIVYKDRELTTQSEFSGTSVWRWLSFLSGLDMLVQSGLRLIREKTASCSIFRDVYLVSKRKYRTTMRKDQLIKSMKLLKVEERFRKYFGNSIFPHFAIRYGSS